MNGYQIGSPEAVAEQLLTDAKWAAHQFLAKLPASVSSKLDWQDMASEGLEKALEYPPTKGAVRSRGLTVRMMIGAMAASIGLRKVDGKTKIPALPIYLDGMGEETDNAEREHYQHLVAQSLRRPEPDHALVLDAEKAVMIEKLALLGYAVEQLPDDYRKVIELRWGINGVTLSYKAMGLVLGRSHQTCINHEARALQILVNDGVIPHQLIENPKLGVRWYAALQSAAGIDNDTNVVSIRSDEATEHDGVENAEEEKAA